MINSELQFTIATKVAKWKEVEWYLKLGIRLPVVVLTYVAQIRILKYMFLRGNVLTLNYKMLIFDIYL